MKEPALIAAGARLDLQNAHGWAVADFAQQQAIPDFLRKAFEGDPFECQRVTSLACSEPYIEERF